MAEKAGAPLATIAGFPPAIVQKLAELWLTTAEEFVMAAIQKDGIQGFAQYLALSVGEVTDLVRYAMETLPPGFSFGPESVEEHGLGALDEPPAQAGGNSGNPTSPRVLPSQVHWHALLSPVRDQGMRGTCVPHACLAVHEYLLREQRPDIDLSEQFLYWNCKETDNHPLAGTIIHVALNCLRGIGVCEEHVWPYNREEIANNEGQGPPPAEAMGAAARQRIGRFVSWPASDIDMARQYLAEGSLVIFAIPIYRYWWTLPVNLYGDIRLPLPFEKQVGRHAMCLTGYEDDPLLPGGGYFLVRNSWGTNWAGQSQHAGYCRLPYSYLESHALTAYTFFLS